MKPLVKWPGGKRFLASALADIVLRQAPIRHYFEPFAGGAALFFALRPRIATLADANSELINLYTVVRDTPEEFVRVLRSYRNSESAYYRIRESRPITPHTRAARLYYLMRLSFNGIYRENRDGDFNVPYGRKSHLSVCDLNSVRAAHTALQSASIVCADFRQSTHQAQGGDLVYFDPPYTVRHNNNGFIKYNRKLFEWNDQVELSNLAHALVDRGCYVIVSNADHVDVAGLYADFNHLIVTRRSIISAESYGRALTTERLMFSRNTPMVD